MVDRHKAAMQFGSFMALIFVAWTLRATSFYEVDDAIASPTLRAVYSNLLKLLIWVLPAAGFVYWLKQLPPARYWAYSSPPRRWDLCLWVTAAFLLTTATFELSVGGKSISFVALDSTPLLIGLLSFLVSPLLEEIFFRGFVLKELSSLLTPTFANVLTSLLFVAIHLPYWLTHAGLARSLMATGAGVFLLSLLAGWLYAKSGSIWPPTVAHIANNILSALLVVRPV